MQHYYKEIQEFLCHAFLHLLPLICFFSVEMSCLVSPEPHVTHVPNKHMPKTIQLRDIKVEHICKCCQNVLRTINWVLIVLTFNIALFLL